MIFEFKESISYNTSLSVVLHKPVYSENNAKLKKYKFMVYLNELIYIDPDIKALIENFDSTSKAMVTTSIGISIVSNPAAAWAMIGTLQLLPYIPLSKYYNDEATIKFFTSAGGFNLIPNVMVYVFDMNSSSVPYERAKIIGIETSVFWINFGKIILLLLILICLWPFVTVASMWKIGKLTLKLLKFLKNYKYSLFLRFWIQAYLDIGVYSIIQLKSVKTSQSIASLDAQYYFNQLSAAASIVISI